MSLFRHGSKHFPFALFCFHQNVLSLIFVQVNIYGKLKFVSGKVCKKKENIESKQVKGKIKKKLQEELLPLLYTLDNSIVTMFSIFKHILYEHICRIVEFNNWSTNLCFFDLLYNYHHRWGAGGLTIKFELLLLNFWWSYS